MEMEMEVNDVVSVMERLAAAADGLEQAAQRIAGMEIAAAQSRESELEARLAEAEALIVSLKAGVGGRKTIAAGAMAAKDGVSVEAGALDAALTSLSVEQRIAVKAGLMRSGLLG